MNKYFDLLKLVYIHPLMWAVIAVAVATAHFVEVSLLLFIIFIHEMGHAAAAAFFSWRVRKISLLPFGGVAEMEEHGNRPLFEEAIVVLAGPIQHVWLMVLGLFLYFSGLFPEYWYSLFIEYNLMILLFNLFPIWPLDGGKILFLLFSLNKPFPEAHLHTLSFSAVSLMVFILIVLLTAPFTLNVWIIMIFLAVSLYIEWKQRRYIFIRFLMERYYGKQEGFRSMKPLRVAKEDLLVNVLQKFQRGCKHPVIVEHHGMETALDENELLHAYFTDKLLTAKISDLLYTY
ncbi:M50 family metallopeptidase [Bacillus sp. T33-2]|uniref:M50 family metallopeptidase n=1 Tax=Bacillus sp. T33-2 TaxID=2054168 RepID=UPI000C78CFDC|nr:M50 family metallopeptidase [Bacillus sp. T33-2]PLR93724.1 stage IV sporulation protein FB [Bacillus sp. T33-2]